MRRRNGVRAVRSHAPTRCREAVGCTAGGDHACMSTRSGSLSVLRSCSVRGRPACRRAERRPRMLLCARESNVSVEFYCYSELFAGISRGHDGCAGEDGRGHRSGMLGRRDNDHACGAGRVLRTEWHESKHTHYFWMECKDILLHGIERACRIWRRACAVRAVQRATLLPNGVAARF